MRIIVCMTSIPGRSKNICNVIDSLLDNTILPYKIIISICNNYLRFDEKYDLTVFEKYKNNSIIEINLIEEDIGPGTKVLGVLPKLLKMENIDDIYLLTADDDLSYQKTFIETFKNKILLEPDTIWTGYMTNVKDYKTCFGADGITMKLSELTQLEKYARLFIEKCPKVFYHDDVIFSTFMLIKKKNIKLTRARSRIVGTYTFQDEYSLTKFENNIDIRNHNCRNGYIQLLKSGKFDEFKSNIEK